MAKKTFFLLIILSFSKIVSGQQNYTWYHPSYVEGTCVQDTLDIFHRLPSALKKQVRQPVWDLSLNTAGEYIDFTTDAENLTVKYLVSGTLAMPHMPATSVSGVALWAIDQDGRWKWAPGNYQFADTITYSYHSLVFLKTGTVNFRLYLPLYNTVAWLKIGVPQGKKLTFCPKNQDKPIVAYGTSILQGAVASRPDLAWTNILSRAIDRTVVNLGFSGNGRIEAPIINLMATVDAKMYIIDCMPNLTKNYGIPDDEINKRINYAITKLREKHKSVPILFACHSGGYAIDYLDTARANLYRQSSNLMVTIFNRLQKNGVSNIYLLRDKDIAWDVNSTTDGLHPNDIGMVQYAVAYEKKIRQILKEPKGMVSTTIAARQSRGAYNWLEQHEHQLNDVEKNHPLTVFIGNSVAGIRERLHESKDDNENAPLQNDYRLYSAQNLAIADDRIENILWRIYHGELDGYAAKNVFLMPGTNEVKRNSDEVLLAGYKSLISAIKYRQPNAVITLIGILPARDIESRISHLNSRLMKVASENHIRFTNIGNILLSKNKHIIEALFEDGVYPNERGHQLLKQELGRLITIHEP